MSAAVASLGPLGILLLMVPESACVPLPSELTLLSAGYGVHQAWFSFPVAVAAATAGNLIGSTIAYWLGRLGVLDLLPRNGGVAVGRCERLLERHGESTVFLARLLPLARTFVSLPAGHARIPFGRFVPLTIAGCAIWSAAFILAGDLAGAGWERVASIAGRGSLVFTAVAIAALVPLARRGSRREP
jgi:membrane protein DedA with SNARE-associated domain